MSEPQVTEEWVDPGIDDDYFFDYSECAYYKRCHGRPGYEDGICSFGCHDEPACITDEPEGGWPTRVFDKLR